MVTVTECERVQANWFHERAKATGQAWVDDGHLWTDEPEDGLNLMFPTVIDPAAVERGVVYAVERGRTPVGAWLGLEADPTPLTGAGFERGWAPWWMTADLAAVGAPDDARIAVEEYSGRAWHAVAYAENQVAGQAWSFLDGDLAGVFDMDVWPRFQRRGIGTGLLRAVCGAARNAGAKAAVLNATPQGKMLYSTCGFEQIGEGITYWLHLRPGSDQL